MANLKEVRERITSVNNTQQITKAMKMVSAAKLRRAQEAIQRLRPYSEKQDEILGNILSNMDGDTSSSFGNVRALKHVALVVVTSSRGLCGAFNANIIKTAIAKLQGDYAALVKEGRVEIICIGKRGADAFKRTHPNLVNDDYATLFTDLSFDNVARVSTMLMKKFDNGDVDEINVSYGKFVNAAVQNATLEQWLPVKLNQKDVASGDGTFNADYIFEPNKQTLLEQLIPAILKTSFQKYVLDTNASEHGARMTAMDKATENAQELIRDLKIMYNKARQEAITTEISEIVGGSAALEGAT